MKIGCKIILIHNMDGLTNGQLGILIGTIKAEDGSISKCIVKFKKEKIGMKNRAKNQQYANKYPTGTVIEKVSFSYSLSKKATTASSKIEEISRATFRGFEIVCPCILWAIIA